MLAEPTRPWPAPRAARCRGSGNLEEQLVPRAGGLEVHRRRVAVLPDGDLVTDLLGLAVADFLQRHLGAAVEVDAGGTQICLRPLAHDPVPHGDAVDGDLRLVAVAEVMLLVAFQ